MIWLENKKFNLIMFKLLIQNGLKIQSCLYTYSRWTKFRILIQKAPEEGYGGQCLEIPAVIIEGETVEELEANMEESIELALESFYTV